MERTGRLCPRSQAPALLTVQKDSSPLLLRGWRLGSPPSQKLVMTWGAPHTTLSYKAAQDGSLPRCHQACEGLPERPPWAGPRRQEQPAWWGLPLWPGYGLGDAEPLGPRELAICWPRGRTNYSHFPGAPWCGQGWEPLLYWKREEETEDWRNKGSKTLPRTHRVCLQMPESLLATNLSSTLALGVGLQERILGTYANSAECRLLRPAAFSSGFTVPPAAILE